MDRSLHSPCFELDVTTSVAPEMSLQSASQLLDLAERLRGRTLETVRALQGGASAPAVKAAVTGVVQGALGLAELAFDLCQDAAPVRSAAERPRLVVSIRPAREPDRWASAATQATVFRREEDRWVISYAGRTVHMQNRRGLTCLADLLRRPGERVPALQLWTSATGPMRSNSGVVYGLLEARQRLANLTEELRDAEDNNDIGRAERARVELESASRECVRAIGFGVRAQRAGSAGERARVNVSRAIAATLRKIRQENRELAAHFSATVRTGTFCSYSPDPSAAPSWRL